MSIVPNLAYYRRYLIETVESAPLGLPKSSFDEVDGSGYGRSFDQDQSFKDPLMHGYSTPERHLIL